TAHRDEDPIPLVEHVVMTDRSLHLSAEDDEEAVLAERAVVPADLDRGGAGAPPALHDQPPEMTGRTSTSSPSAIRSSRVTSSPARITSTVSGSTPSSSRTSRTLRPPATSTSRSGLRSLTLTDPG